MCCLHCGGLGRIYLLRLSLWDRRLDIWVHLRACGDMCGRGVDIWGHAGTLEVLAPLLQLYRTGTDGNVWGYAKRIADIWGHCPFFLLLLNVLLVNVKGGDAKWGHLWTYLGIFEGNWGHWLFHLSLWSWETFGELRICGNFWAGEGIWGRLISFFPPNFNCSICSITATGRHQCEIAESRSRSLNGATEKLKK